MVTTADWRKLLRAGFHPLGRLLIVLLVLVVGPALLIRARHVPTASLGDIEQTASHRATSRPLPVANAEPSGADKDQARPATAPSATGQPHQQSDAISHDIAQSRLQAIYGRGQTAMERAADLDQQVAAARLVYIAAALSYRPARASITREYPRSPAIRAAVPAADAVRFSLDAVSDRGDPGAHTFMVLVAAYFAGHDELPAYSKYLLDALSDERNLQSDDVISSLLYDLSRVSGVCVALARAIVRVRTATGPACSSQLRLQIESYLSRSAPSDVAAQSRRHALEMLESQADTGSNRL